MRIRCRDRQCAPAYARLTALVLAAIASLPATAASLVAQTVQGIVLDSLTDRPVHAVLLTLVDSSGTPASRSESDGHGRFHLTAPRPGRYRVYADRLGYVAFLGDTLSLDGGVRVELAIRLRPEPVPLAEMEVRVRRAEERMRRVGFDRRRLVSMGYFLTPEEVEERKPLIATDLLRDVPRIRLVWSQRKHTYLVTLRGVAAGGEGCPMKIVVDGNPVMTEAATLDDVVSAGDVLAVEAYPNMGGVGAPAQYRGPDAYCGVVLIWTKGR